MSIEYKRDNNDNFDHFRAKYTTWINQFFFLRIRLIEIAQNHFS